MADGSVSAPTPATRREEDLKRMVVAADMESKVSTYTVGPLEAHEQAADRLGTRLTQAHALVSAISTEEGAAAFATLNDVIQREYLWALSDLISAARIDAAICVRAENGNG